MLVSHIGFTVAGMFHNIYYIAPDLATLVMKRSQFEMTSRLVRDMLINGQFFKYVMPLVLNVVFSFISPN